MPRQNARPSIAEAIDGPENERLAGSSIFPIAHSKPQRKVFSASSLQNRGGLLQ